MALLVFQKNSGIKKLHKGGLTDVRRIFSESQCPRKFRKNAYFDVCEYLPVFVIDCTDMLQNKRPRENRGESRQFIVILK